MVLPDQAVLFQFRRVGPFATLLVSHVIQFRRLWLRRRAFVRVLVLLAAGATATQRVRCQGLAVAGFAVESAATRECKKGRA